MIIAGLLTWLLVPLFNAWMDRKGAKRNYLIVNLLRGIAMIVHSVIFFDPQGGYHFFKDVLSSIPYLIYYFGSYWILFEIFLNIWQGRIKQLGLFDGLLYYDQSEGDSGMVDRFFKWTGAEFHFWVKFGVLVLVIISGMVILYK